MLALCAGLAFSGCATDTHVTGRDDPLTGEKDPRITEKDVIGSVALAAELDREREEREAKEKKERREARARDLERDIDKVVSGACYSGDLRRMKELGAMVHRYDAGTPIESLSTSESFRREYGTGGGGGGGGC